jgi:hypothetical protein
VAHGAVSKLVHGNRMGVTRKQTTFSIVRDPRRTAGRVMLSGDMDIYAAAELERAFESLSGREIVIDVARCAPSRQRSSARSCTCGGVCPTAASK